MVAFPCGLTSSATSFVSTAMESANVLKGNWPFREARPCQWPCFHSVDWNCSDECWLRIMLSAISFQLLAVRRYGQHEE